MVYTGIGSRITPQNILSLMREIAQKLSLYNYTLRSGGSSGADSAFESSAKLKEIYLPWKGFNGNISNKYTIPSKAFDIAETCHLAWGRCTETVKKFHARNVQQVLGQDLDKKSDFVICWTPRGMLVGGTATALTLAIKNNIQIFNLELCDVSEIYKYTELKRIE